MGRNCGWLTANTAKFYYEDLDKVESGSIPPFNIKRYGIHGLYIPEMKINFTKSKILNIV